MNVKIIAELAQGFEGNFDQAKLLIKAAALAGADIAKFQLVYADELATPDYKYYDLFRNLEMEDKQWHGLAEIANQLNIKLYLDVFGIRGLELAERIDIEGVKLHGTDIANIGLLNRVGKSSVKKILLGAGGANLSEIELSLSILKEKEVTVLLGFQSYPTPNETNHIDRVRFLNMHLKKKFSNFNIGFADHASPQGALGHSLAATAVGAGALIIEKHLTLGQIMKLEDYESALNPDEFHGFVEIIRTCSLAMGETSSADDFGMTESEKDYRKMIRRHVVASRHLEKDSIISPEDIILKRTSESNVITDFNSAYNKKVNRSIKKNTAILNNYIS
jgi:sialic acid synthase SpsE